MSWLMQAFCCSTHEVRGYDLKHQWVASNNLGGINCYPTLLIESLTLPSLVPRPFLLWPGNEDRLCLK